MTTTSTTNSLFNDFSLEVFFPVLFSTLSSHLSLQCWWEVWCHVPHKCASECYWILPVHSTRWDVDCVTYYVSVSIALNIYGCSYCFLTIFGISSHQNCFIIIMAKWLKVKNLVESGVKQFPITSFQAFWRVPATSMCGGSHLMCRSVTWSLAPGPTMAGCWTSKW